MDKRRYLIFEFPAEQYDYIIHALTDADTNLNTENPLLMLNTITECTKRILEYARLQSVLKAILLTSSYAVYGQQSDNITHITEEDSFQIDKASKICIF